MKDVLEVFRDKDIPYDVKMFLADELINGTEVTEALSIAEAKLQVDWASNNVMGIYGNVWFRNLDMEMGKRIQEHAHEHPHITLIGHGSVMAHIEGYEPRMFKAGEAVAVPATKAHSFQALEPNTVAFCTYAVRNDETGEVQDWEDCLKLFKPTAEQSPDLLPHKLKPEKL